MNNQYLKFLETLSQNNNKTWMDANRDWYLKIRENLLADVEVILQGVTQWEPLLSGFKAKDCVFRQNRDVRFSANKDPYKTNLAAYFSVGGKKSSGPGYYLHIQPGGSFIAGGIWMPPADVLKKIRQEIDYSGKEFLSVLEVPEFKKTFGGLQGDTLKTSPKGYESDHPFIELLKFKSFIVSTPLQDSMIADGSFKNHTIEVFRQMKPFHDFLNRAAEDVNDGEGLL